MIKLILFIIPMMYLYGYQSGTNQVSKIIFDVEQSDKFALYSYNKLNNKDKLVLIGYQNSKNNKFILKAWSLKFMTDLFLNKSSYLTSKKNLDIYNANFGFKISNEELLLNEYRIYFKDCATGPNKYFLINGIQYYIKTSEKSTNSSLDSINSLNWRIKYYNEGKIIYIGNFNYENHKFILKHWYLLTPFKINEKEKILLKRKRLLKKDLDSKHPERYNSSSYFYKKYNIERKTRVLPNKKKLVYLIFPEIKKSTDEKIKEKLELEKKLKLMIETRKKWKEAKSKEKYQ